MGEWKAQLNLRVRQALRAELEEFAAREKRKLGNVGEVIAVSDDLLGGTGKAEEAKLLGVGIIPELCPMERVDTEKWTEPGPVGDDEQGRQREAKDRFPESRALRGVI
jgi:hypothetical protein